jgi:hypothetical protein
MNFHTYFATLHQAEAQEQAALRKLSRAMTQNDLAGPVFTAPNDKVCQ